MRRQDQIVEARKLLAYLDNRTTALADGIYRNPVTDYTCPQQAARERELFFRKGAFNIGLSALLPNPGDWMTHDYTGVPILLVRDARRHARRLSQCLPPSRRPRRRGQRQRRARISAAPITAGATGSTAR